MTSPWTTTVVAGLTFDGTNVMDWPTGIFLDVAVGIGETPAVRGEDTTVPGLAGRVPGNRVVDVLGLELRGCVRAADSETVPADMVASYITNLLAVRNLFRSSRQPADLVATLRNGTVLTISARPLNLIPAESIPGEYADVSISLEGLGDWSVS